MEKIIIINGPNLNLTGDREREQYGSKSFEEYLNNELLPFAKEISCEIEYFQSNHEGCIIDKIHESREKADYIIINPGALSHYSYAIHDALKAVGLITIEIHISNIFNREKWRSKSVITPAVKAVISGLGLTGYKLAMRYLTNT